MGSRLGRPRRAGCGNGDTGGTLAGFLVAVAAASAVRLAFGTSAGRPENALVRPACGSSASRRTGSRPRSARPPACSCSTVATRPAGRCSSRCTDATRTTRSSRPSSGGRSCTRATVPGCGHTRPGGRARGTRDAPGQGRRRPDSKGRHGRRDQVRRRADRVPRSRASRASRWPRLRRWTTSGCSAGAGEASTWLSSTRQTSPTSRSTRHRRGRGRRSRHRRLRGATVSPSEDQLETDRVQLLVTTATVAGTDRAVRAAVEALGASGSGPCFRTCSRQRSGLRFEGR